MFSVCFKRASLWRNTRLRAAALGPPPWPCTSFCRPRRLPRGWARALAPRARCHLDESRPEAARRSPRCPRQRLACCRTTSRDCTRRDGGRDWSAPRLVTPRGARQLSATVRRCKMCSSRQTSRRSSCGATSRSAPVRPACTVTSVCGTLRSRLHARLPHQGAPLARTHICCPPHTRTQPQTQSMSRTAQVGQTFPGSTPGSVVLSSALVGDSTDFPSESVASNRVASAA